MSRQTLLSTVLMLAAGAASGSERLGAGEPKPAANPPAIASRPTARVVRRYRSAPVAAGRTVSESEAQALVDAPISRNYISSGFAPRSAPTRNYGPTDVGGRGTATGRGISQVPDEPFSTTTLYGGYSHYFSPLGYGSLLGTGGMYGFGWGFGYRPMWYFPAGIGASYNPYFYYGSSYYGGLGVPPWSGYGGFGYPYSYAAYGYPYYSFMRPAQMYFPTYAYFMYPGVGGLYVPPGYFNYPGYFGYGGYGAPLGFYGYGGAFYW